MILLRHCQSLFNEHYSRTGRDPGIVDPRLTPEGRLQAERAAALLCGDGAPTISRLLVSPYRRTLQTAAPIAARLGLVPEIEPLVRERFAFSCDVGSPPADLASEWPGLDFSGLGERWWHVDGPEGATGDAVGSVVETEAGVLHRAARFRRQAMTGPSHATTLLVSHWGFLLALSGRSLLNGQSVPFDPALPPPAEISWR